MNRTFGFAAALGAGLLLQGCLSLSADPPDQLLTLTPSRTAAAGTSSSGDSESALAVMPLQSSQRLDVTRIPVHVSDSSIAYLKDAIWVEKPAELFGRLLAETIRSKGTRLVVNGSDMQYVAATKLSGHLVEMGYDAPTSSVVVSFEGVLQTPDGKVRTQRFSERVEGVPAQAAPVGTAMNEAANTIADQVAEWVG